MNKDLEILRRLLSEADEDEATEETPKEDEKETKEEKPKKGSFEEDPMGFILKKYHSLNELMEELMTPSFKDYVDGIFLMAPKPTTFKVLLHNGQYFFLTYLGVPDKADRAGVYEATIEGKRYYLAGIGETERCMVAIARLLRFGTPLKTKGPEGAEQGTRDNTGMEGDWAEKTGEMAAGGEAGGVASAETPAASEEPGEELKENLKILKKLLINEGKSEEDLLKSTISSLKNSGIDAKRVKKSDTDAHVRAILGDQKNAIDNIKKSLGGKVDVSIVAPGERSKGSQSDTFETYKFVLKSDLENVPKGTTLYVVNQTREGKSTVAAKSLTPGAFGMNGKTYKNSKAIINSVQSGLNSMPNKQLSSALSLLLKDVDNIKSEKVGNISEIKDYTKLVPLSKDTQKALTSVLPGDLDMVGKDFGEILGAVLMAKEINLQEGIHFPKGNEPLTDFYVDGYGISSKYKKGAAATLTRVVEELDPENLTTKEQKEFYKTFTEAFKLGVSDSYLKLARKYAPQQIGALAYTMGIPENQVTVQAINDYIVNLLPKKIPNQPDPKLDKKILQKFDQFFGSTKSKPSLPIKWGSLAKNGNYYGIVMAPLAAAVAKKLNEDPKYTKVLKEIIGKVEIKQLYLDFNLKSNSMSFKLKSFADPNASFSFTPANISVYNPDNGKMGFKMK